MTAFKPTLPFRSYRIYFAEVCPSESGQFEILDVLCSRVRGPEMSLRLEFALVPEEKRLSAFLRAAGIETELKSADQLIGRYVAVLNDDRGVLTAQDFESLERATKQFEAYLAAAVPA